MNTPPQTSVSLVLRLKNAVDVEAWDSFVKVYSPLIYHLAQSKGLQPSDAADVTQEVLLRVAKSVQDWQPDPALGTFRGWLARITRNLTIEFLRKKGRQALTGEDTQLRSLLEQGTECDADVGTRFDLERDRQVFLWAAEKIRDRFDSTNWQAFWRTAVDGRAIEEIAEELQMSRGAVYVARSRIMARLVNVVREFEMAESGELPPPG